METYYAPKGHCNANAASALGTRSVTSAMHRGAWNAETPTHLGTVSPQRSSTSAVAMEVTTLPTVVVAESARKQSERKGARPKRRLLQPDVARVRSFTDVCDLRVKRRHAQKGPL
jgi:hypothetical protein